MTNNHKRRNAIIAAAAGVALLMGGSTYALWSASANLSGGKIIAGDLNIVGAAMNYWDVSADRSDATAIVTNSVNTAQQLGALLGHNITNIVTAGTEAYDQVWSMVPGDTVAITYPYTITLVGDNLVGALTINASALTAATAGMALDANITLKYALYDQKGVELSAPAALPAADTTPVGYFQGDNTTQTAGQLEAALPAAIPVVETDGTAVITLVIFATFDAATSGRDDVTDTSATTVQLTTLVDASKQLTAKLEQVRTAGVGNFVTPAAPATP